MNKDEFQKALEIASPLFEETTPGSAKNYKYLSEYIKTFRKPIPIPISRVSFGDILSFPYRAKFAPEEGIRLRWVWTLTIYERKLHCLELTKISPEEGSKIVVPRMLENQEPYTFYHATPGMKEFITELDCYRTFLVDRIPTVLKYIG